MGRYGRLFIMRILAGVLFAALLMFSGPVWGQAAPPNYAASAGYHLQRCGADRSHA